MREIGVAEVEFFLWCLVNNGFNNLEVIRVLRPSRPGLKLSLNLNPLIPVILTSDGGLFLKHDFQVLVGFIPGGYIKLSHVLIGSSEDLSFVTNSEAFVSRFHTPHGGQGPCWHIFWDVSRSMRIFIEWSHRCSLGLSYLLWWQM